MTRFIWTWPGWATATWPGCAPSCGWPARTPSGGAAVKRVVLHQVPDALRTVLHIVGWDSAAELTLAPD